MLSNDILEFIGVVLVMVFVIGMAFDTSLSVKDGLFRTMSSRMIFLSGNLGKHNQYALHVVLKAMYTSMLVALVLWTTGYPSTTCAAIFRLNSGTGGNTGGGNTASAELSGGVCGAGTTGHAWVLHSLDYSMSVGHMVPLP